MIIDRKTLALLVTIPIVYTLLFGGLFSKNVITDVPIVICNLDDGFGSQALIRDLYDTPEVKVIAIENSAAAVVEIMNQNQADGAVVIPKDYSKQVNRGGAASIEVVINNTNRALGAIVSKAVQSVTTAQNATIAVNQRIAAGWNQSQAQSVQLSLSSRMLYNPTIGYIDFFLVSLIIHGLQIAIVFTIVPRIVQVKNLLLNDTTRSLANILLSCSAIMITVTLICLSIGFGVFQMVCRGSWIDIILLISAYVVCMVSFAICVGAWIDEEYKALITPLAYVMPSILFANVTWPRTSMDNFSLFLSYIMPIGYTADDLRCLLVKGVAVELHFHIIILLFIGFVFFTFAVIGVKYHAEKFRTRNTTLYQ